MKTGIFDDLSQENRIVELAEPRRQGKSGDNVLEDKPSCTLFIDNFTSFFPRSVLHFLVFVHDGRLWVRLFVFPCLFKACAISLIINS